MQASDDKIISALKQKKDSFVSGEELSGMLDISRAGVWKHIQKIRDEGYVISALPHLGYRLVKIPDRLIPCEIKYELNTNIIGRKIYSYAELDSTNDTAEKLAMEGGEEGTVVLAETQSKGRGRLGRIWTSPKEKGIYMSLILRPKMSPSEAQKITLVASVALAMAIRKISSLTALIKWPNDIVVNNEKASGILTEITAQPDVIKFIVVGIGINVNTPKELLPQGATSLYEESGKRTIDRIALVQEILRQLEKYYFLFNNGNFGAIAAEWQDLSATLGSRVRVTNLEKTYEGQAMAIDENTGNLIIREDNGFCREVLSGDVEMIANSV